MSKGWTIVRLGDVLVPVSRPESVEATKEYRLLGVRLDGGGPFLRETKFGSQSAATTLYQVKAGDFIYSRLFAWRGAFGVIPDELDGCYVSGEFPVFHAVPSRIDLEFLRLWFCLPKTLEKVEADCTGSTPLTRNRFKEPFFLAMQMPLPPLPEQQRIVARIEQLAGKAEKARKLRQETTQQIHALFARVVSSLFDRQWKMAPIGTLLCENTLNGLAPRPTDTPPGTPILRISAGTSRPDAVVDEGDYKYVQVEETVKEAYRLLPGDLLACRFNGNLHYVGRFALFTGYSKKERIYPDKLIRFRVDTGRVLPEFVRYVANSPQCRTIIESMCATTAGNIGVSAGRLKTLLIPVPSLAEQRRIITFLDRLQIKVNALTAMQLKVSNELDALMLSILDLAFRGDL